MKKNTQILIITILVFVIGVRNISAQRSSDFGISIIPTDTHYEKQWYLKKIQAAEAWDRQNEASKVVIAIIDTGVQIDHPDLRDSIWVNKKEIPNNKRDDDNNGFIDDVNGWDFVANTNDPSPKINANDFSFEGVIHGTVIAGIIAASGNNASGVSGIAWNAQLMPLKALNDKGEGDIRDIIRAIDYAIKNNADIINFSFVGHGYNNGLEAAIERAYKAGIIIVAAAGNDAGAGEGVNLNVSPMYPVCLDGAKKNMVLGVASTDALDQKSYFSGFGSNCVDITAPGESIFSTTVYSQKNIVQNFQFGKYFDGYWSGTSMAAPMVSASAALVKSANPWFDRDDIVKNLKDNADNIHWLNPKYSNQLGSGRLNLNSSVFEAKKAYSKISPIIIPYTTNDNSVNLNYYDKTGKKIKQFDYKGDRLISGKLDVSVSGKKIIYAILRKDGSIIDILNESGLKINEIKLSRPVVASEIIVADIENNGDMELIVAPAAGQKPIIRVYDMKGNVKFEVPAYPQNVVSGLNIAVGDVDGDGKAEIVTGTNKGSGPLIRVFNSKGKLMTQFFAGSQKNREGVMVDLIDLGGGFRGKNLKIISAAVDGDLKIKMFDNKATFMASFAIPRSTEIMMSTDDMNLDGEEEIVILTKVANKQKFTIYKKNGAEVSSFAIDEKNINGFKTIIQINK